MLKDQRDSDGNENDDSLELPVGTLDQEQESCDIRDEAEGTDGKWETIQTKFGKLGNNDPKISEDETDNECRSDQKKR